jgi:arsenite methyltransferase
LKKIGDTQADYGQDAPDLVRQYVMKGGALITAGVLLRIWGKSGHRLFHRGLARLGFVPLLIGIWQVGVGGAIVWSSRVGKLWERDRLLDGLRLRGNERILDVGCGRGLLLIGAAKRLPHGRAVGIDYWSQVDQGDNHEQATYRNAEIEGVADRVEVHTGDMQRLPFEDASFDAIIASQAIHNIEDREGRREAMRQIVRVLQPGGKVAFMDFFYVDQFAEDLQALGMQDVQISAPSLWMYPTFRTVTANKPE